MRLAFDVTSCAKSRRGGIAGYGVNLIAAIARLAPEHELVPCVRLARWRDRRLADDVVSGGKPRLLLDTLQGLTLGGPVDLLHGIGVRLPKNGRFAKVVTVHDLNVFELPELAPEAWRRRRSARLALTVARADAIIAYSEHGREALSEHLDVPRERVHVVPLGVDCARFRPHDDGRWLAARDGLRARLALDDRPYVLALGVDLRRKNHTGLIAAFARAGLGTTHRLVIAGPSGERARQLAEHVARSDLRDDVVRLPGWVADEDLPALVAGAESYVCASLHEGFGLPVLEAQACGTPVVASDRAALPETLGGAGLAFDPDDRDALADCLIQVARDGSLRADLRARGLRHVASGFDWEDVARATLAVYRAALEARASDAPGS